MSTPEPDELDYLREIERLAHDVTVEASAEGRLSYAPDPPDATPFQHSVNALARAVRAYHFEGDGCVEDRPLLELAAAAVLKPGAVPAGLDEDYEQACARFGVEPRPEGWALWHTWGKGGLQVTMVVSAVATTEGLFRNWALGREFDPVEPLPSQIALVHRGWSGPMTFAPRGVRRIGREGTPLA
ncbi:hypothetical protein [Kitasatospora purpeofusca]|uniref:hypothetical protein n=1 Tax=Kitasatospora purpeofusca TaxID=67352 RepID=UPI0036D391C9